MHNILYHLHGSCTTQPLSLWLCKTSRNNDMQILYQPINCPQLMETRFMFPANRSQQVMNTEYAFCNTVMRGLWKKKRKTGLIMRWPHQRTMLLRKLKKKKSERWSRGNFCQILGELCVTLKMLWMLGLWKVCDFNLSLRYWGLGVCGEHSEL